MTTQSHYACFGQNIEQMNREEMIFSLKALLDENGNLAKHLEVAQEKNRLYHNYLLNKAMECIPKQ